MALGLPVVFLFGFGGCHDGGGFCTGGFGGGNLLAYALGALLAALAGAAAGRAVFDDKRASWACAGVAAVAAGIAVYLLET